MKKLLTSTLILFFSLSVFAQSKNLSRQLWRNFNLGWEVYSNNDYRWRNTFLGTGYTHTFESAPKAYAHVGGRINWNKYTLYPDGNFSMGASKATLKTTSISIPAYAGYQLLKQGGFGINAFTGPTFEFVAASRLDGYNYMNNTNIFQSGWTAGGNFQFLYLFRARVAYSYYPTSLMSGTYMPRNSFSFSVGF